MLPLGPLLLFVGSLFLFVRLAVPVCRPAVAVRSPAAAVRWPAAAVHTPSVVVHWHYFAPDSRAAIQRALSCTRRIGGTPKATCRAIRLNMRQLLQRSNPAAASASGRSRTPSFHNNPARRKDDHLRAEELHKLADRLRFLFGTDLQPTDALRNLEAELRTTWESRHRILGHLGGGPAGGPMDSDHLLDLGILKADLGVRLARRNNEATAPSRCPPGARRRRAAARPRPGPGAGGRRSQRIGLTDLARRAPDPASSWPGGTP